MKNFEFIFLFIYFLIGCSLQNEQTNADMCQLLRENNYPSEEYKVETEDGYLLSLFRIPKEGGIPVLLLHGLTFSSVSWIVLGPNNSIAYSLADANYDVWIGNSRGNYYSREYANKSKTVDSKFWDFSLQEMAVYDLPAFIDKIIEETGQEQINFIGHSIGATEYLILNSERSKAYGKKIKFAILLSPIAFVDNIQTTFKLLEINPYMRLGELLGINVEYLPFKGPFQRFLYLSSRIFFLRFIDFLYIKYYYGSFCNSFDKKNIPMIASHYPAGTSSKTVYHLIQLYRDRRVGKGMHFRQYNYGKNNMVRYGQKDPPEYDLSKIKQPVAIFTGTDDTVADIKDVDYLVTKLPNVVEYVKGFHNHVQYLWGKHIDIFVKQILILLENNQ